jgi:cysteine desulfurase
VNGHPDRRLANTSNLSFTGTDDASLVLALDLEGIAVASGAACSSGALEPSHVLRAMGRRAEVDGGAVRFSLGADSCEAQIDRVLEVLPGIVERVRSAAAHGRELVRAGGRGDRA